MDEELRDRIHDILHEYPSVEDQCTELDRALTLAGYRRLPEGVAPRAQMAEAPHVSNDERAYWQEGFLVGQAVQRAADMKWMRGEK